MSKKKQKDIFLQSEGDAWFERNQEDIEHIKLPEDDLVLREILEIIPEKTNELNVLEVGCGEGRRLNWLQSNMKMKCTGIEPSASAVLLAKQRGINVLQGTADSLPFENNSFDIVIFGFCLYLCDRNDLFRIASEADRVLRSSAWLLILDFFSSNYKTGVYHHRTGINCYKMDYRTLFTWHSAYECVTHKIRHHSKLVHTDNSDDWGSISVIRKNATN